MASWVVPDTKYRKKVYICCVYVIVNIVLFGAGYC